MEVVKNIFFSNNFKTRAQTPNPILAHPPVVFFFSGAYYLPQKSRLCPNNAKIGRKKYHPNREKLAPLDSPSITKRFGLIFFHLKPPETPSFTF
jgi:hypothetical protein